MTLVELLVTMAIFVMMAGMMLLVIGECSRAWREGERRRVLYEKAMGVLRIMADDISAALTREPRGVDEVRVRFIGDIDPGSGGQRLMFVRSFEAGPERAYTLFAGDLSAGPPAMVPFEDRDGDGRPDDPKVGGAEEYDLRDDNGDGFVDYPLRALGGMVQVGYFVEGDTLYRAVRAPARTTISDIMTPARARPLCADCLHFSLRYWGQRSASWEILTDKSGRLDPGGALPVWDSTRGLTANGLQHFPYHRGAASLDDPEDDIFPQTVMVTLTVDADIERAVKTRLEADASESAGRIEVTSTRGFPGAGTGESYLRIGQEWAHYSEKGEDYFVLDIRGARATRPAYHNEGEIARCGRTFTRVIYLPAFREDWSSDQVFWARQTARGRVP
ncbi:MAG: prepilin-type N-terminal cleavage/methylation domain-containing protein [Planctomycetota bacterium]|nr:prepilin-type N-terminal cleavage/methylation domain-containing protein [Planctomycetota bacterium]